MESQAQRMMICVEGLKWEVCGEWDGDCGEAAGFYSILDNDPGLG